MAKQIVDAFETMSGQFQLAARYVLDHPRDVALLSMREQARRARVKPATMTRLAKHLGLSGYDELRQRYAQAVRKEARGFAPLAGAQVQSQKLKGDQALAVDMVHTLAGQFSAMLDNRQLEALVEAAQTLSRARRIYCLGMRSSFGAAWHFNYIMSLLGEDVVLLDGAGGTGFDASRRAKPHDAMLVISVAPYTRATVEIAEHVARRGVPICAITDSSVAPLAQVAANTILVPTKSPSFFHTMTPAYAVAEMLAALIAGHKGRKALDALAEADEQMALFNTHLNNRTGHPL